MSLPPPAQDSLRDVLGLTFPWGLSPPIYQAPRGALAFEFILQIGHLNTKNKCFFCDEDGDFGFVSGIDGYTGKCSVCGNYSICRKVIAKHLVNAGAQAKVNCSHYNLSNQTEIDGRYYHPFWLLKEEVEEFNRRRDGVSIHNIVRNSVGISYYDIAFKEIDHSRKPYELLIAVSDKLKNAEEGAFEVFYFEKEDTIRSKIPIQEESSIASYLEKRGVLTI